MQNGFWKCGHILPPKGMKEDHQSLCVVGVWYPEKLCSWTEKIVAF